MRLPLELSRTKLCRAKVAKMFPRLLMTNMINFCKSYIPNISYHLTLKKKSLISLL